MKKKGVGSLFRTFPLRKGSRPFFSLEFLACAICKEGKDKNLIYGCISWGLWVDKDRNIYSYGRNFHSKPEEWRAPAIDEWNYQAGLKDPKKKNHEAQEPLGPFK